MGGKNTCITYSHRGISGLLGAMVKIINEYLHLKKKSENCIKHQAEENKFEY
jgi:hypothetical protein